ncbi:efflux RND transporter permease subunit [Sphingomonas crocodyli]|uniref:Efflux RND transporter permease subunit n=1 Tax=Sphingomonas crocodyli TaxID=1979270 RepID=A0A437LXK1_9SPHN|nr:efflux RND transporter permease subunit [Sphingomonas crocodyli]RVT90148.1 efflux RND transporter permease subunit [Sphingomonas crocodyli]
MKGPNLSDWAIRHAASVRFILALSVLVGLVSFLELSRQEDPSYTVKNMIITVAWPGADAATVVNMIAEPVEDAILSLPDIEYVKSDAQPERITFNVKIRDDVSPSRVAQIWGQARQRVGDIRGRLPETIKGPSFDDDVGKTYGNIYAITGEGFPLEDLRPYARRLRSAIRMLPDAGRVEFAGFPEERVYIDYDPARLAALGVDPAMVSTAVRDAVAINPTGSIVVGPERIRLVLGQVAGSLSALREIPLAQAPGSLTLGDVAVISKQLTDPPTFQMRVNRAPAIGVLVNLRDGGDSNRLGQDIGRIVAQEQRNAPLGVRFVNVADQPAIVKHAIGEFLRSLLEAVVIVLAVSFFSLGTRAGLVVALCIPIVFALTFAAMYGLSIPLHRVSLGALIIALGLLVDDAIIVIEQIETSLRAGMGRLQAVISSYPLTAQPMLVGTLITAIGFLPIALAQSSSGEYARAIFEVVAIALGSSWIVAVIVTPLFANRLLANDGHAGAESKPVYATPFYGRARATVAWVIENWRIVVAGTALLVFLSALLFATIVPKQFFPASDRLELIVDLKMAKDGDWRNTSKVTARLEQLLVQNKDVASTAAYIGGTSPRFYLSLENQPPSPAFAQIVVKTRDHAARDRTIKWLRSTLNSSFPEVRGRVSRLELGPAVGQPIKIRVSGEDFDSIKTAADQVEAMMRADPRARDVNQDFGEPAKTVRINLDMEKARALGISRSSVQQALSSQLSGMAVAASPAGRDPMAIVARGEEVGRSGMVRLENVLVPTPSGASVPLLQVAQLTPGFEAVELHRRSGRPTITVQADVADIQPVDLLSSWTPRLETIRAQAAGRADIIVGGVVEDSKKSQLSVFKQVFAALVLILILLIMQVGSVKKLIIVLSTGPLALIGVAMILSLFQIPFGFVALLGALALFGMVSRNAVILLAQIDSLVADGFAMFDAIVEAAIMRFRPIILTTLAATLGMIPLTRSVFWGPMAWTIMGGLIIGTAVTLLFVPAIYAGIFAVRRSADGSTAHA